MALVLLAASDDVLKRLIDPNDLVRHLLGDVLDAEDKEEAENHSHIQQDQQRVQEEVSEQRVLYLPLLVDHLRAVEEESLLHGLHLVLSAAVSLLVGRCARLVHFDLVNNEEEGLDSMGLLALPGSGRSLDFT